ncbi:MAG: tRNA (adenosine(37)-N6)-threonylcarbamoyltransferase complex ATPase subunit type 1 TsaE [Desulfobulbus sp.]|nr:tRNA (adenosine(37)-N6)-threonylcarbamoyltransferase complex ATPase subunit type 1 TsaE [Desulfobulbus sp.]
MQPLASALAGVVRPGDVLLLFGPLGAGKTTFTQALARELGVGDEQYVSSPSYALLHEYQGRLPIAHMDLYRLADEDDIEAAGLLDYLGQEVLCIVEWPERLGDLTPETRLEIVIAPVAAEGRCLCLTPHGEGWQERFLSLQALLVGADGPG